jgi:hypothetical protein
MTAELFGRATGTNKGKGGSMHIADTSVGMLGATGIVGAGTPLALGAALSASRKRTKQVAVAFFGDGAMGQGTVYECLNMAAIWKLPMLFVCENNGYAESTPAEYALSTPDMATRAQAFNVAAEVVGRTYWPCMPPLAERLSAHVAAKARAFSNARRIATTVTFSVMIRIDIAALKKRSAIERATVSVGSSNRARSQQPSWIWCVSA